MDSFQMNVLPSEDMGVDEMLRETVIGSHAIIMGPGNMIQLF
jgi:hypothetical protein